MQSDFDVRVVFTWPTETVPLKCSSMREAPEPGGFPVDQFQAEILLGDWLKTTPGKSVKMAGL